MANDTVRVRLPFSTRLYDHVTSARVKVRSLAAICRQATIVLGEELTANGAGLMPWVQGEWVPAGSSHQIFFFCTHISNI